MLIIRCILFFQVSTWKGSKNIMILILSTAAAPLFALSLNALFYCLSLQGCLQKSPACCNWSALTDLQASPSVSLLGLGGSIQILIVLTPRASNYLVSDWYQNLQYCPPLLSTFKEHMFISLSTIWDLKILGAWLCLPMCLPSNVIVGSKN